MSTNNVSTYSLDNYNNSGDVSASAAEEPIQVALSAISSPHVEHSSPVNDFLSRYELALKYLNEGDNSHLRQARESLQIALQHDPRGLKEGGYAAQLREAQFIYAKMCLHGQGGPIEEGKGLSYLQAASMDKHSGATFEWALHLFKSKPEKAKDMMEMASSQGCPQAKIYLALFSLEENPEEAQKLLEEARKLDHPSPEYALARLLYNQEDRRRALAWIEKAAKQNNPDAIYDFAQSIKASAPAEYALKIKHSAHLKCAEAQFEMGMQYAGWIEPAWLSANYAKAREFLLKAALQDHPGALHALGALYQSGDGVAVDYVLARKLYTKAINAAKRFRHGPLFAPPFNQAEAYRALGDMARNGAGCAPDAALAFEFFRRS